MGEMIHMPWLGHSLLVVDSEDKGLIGMAGTIVSETKNTLTIDAADGRRRQLSKAVIRFQLDQMPTAISGSQVCQRTEDRINQIYRRME